MRSRVRFRFAASSRSGVHRRGQQPRRAEEEGVGCPPTTHARPRPPKLRPLRARGGRAEGRGGPAGTEVLSGNHSLHAADAPHNRNLGGGRHSRPGGPPPSRRSGLSANCRHAIDLRVMEGGDPGTCRCTGPN